MDLVTFGETMIVFNPVNSGPLRYVHDFRKQIGGAESNVAIGIQRLGHKAGWFSTLGNDEFGRNILSFVRGEGVDVSHVRMDDRAATGIYFKERRYGDQLNVYYYRKGSAASLMSPEDLNEAYMKQAKILHVTGITPFLSSSCYRLMEHAVQMAKRNQMMVSFDPNIRYKLLDQLTEKKQPQQILLELASASDVVMPGLGEGRFITGKKRPEDIAEYFLMRGVSVVIIKLGDQGAYYSTTSDNGYVPAYPVREVVDPVGAGDGFAAGVLAGYLKGYTWESAVKLGNAVGAFMVMTDGDVEGLPTFAEVTQFVAEQNDDVMR